MKFLCSTDAVQVIFLLSSVLCLLLEKSSKVFLSTVQPNFYLLLLDEKTKLSGCAPEAISDFMNLDAVQDLTLMNKTMKLSLRVIMDC